MDKKDLYEHLAKIYLDASSKTKKKNKNPRRAHPAMLWGVFIGLIGVIFLLVALKDNALQPNTQIALVVSSEAAKINFHFDPAQKEVYSLDLNSLDLNKYKTLSFAVKKTKFTDSLSLRVEFINKFKEKAEVYLKDIPLKWQDYNIPLGDFKSINSWSDMQKLNFTVERWNAKGKQGVVYIDDIKFIR
ncbi:MAG: hypothetical protein WC510_04910 [Candidatus Omnitrophota bacterium]